MFTGLSSSIFIILVGTHIYVGPGLGLGAIAAFFGVIFAILLAFLGIIWYPFKKIIKKLKARRNSDNLSNKS